MKMYLDIQTKLKEALKNKVGDLVTTVEEKQNNKDLRVSQDILSLFRWIGLNFKSVRLGIQREAAHENEPRLVA